MRTDQSLEGRVSEQQPVSVQSLVEAIDQRARQAGTEGATTVLRGLVGTVADSMAAIEDRLASIEQFAATASAPSAPDVSGQLTEVLQSLNARLGRLEEAFVRAVEDSSEGTVSISDRVAEVISEFLDERLPASQPGAGPVDDRTDEVLAAVKRMGQMPAPAPAPAVATSASPLDGESKAKLDRVAADIERLLRQEQSGRLVQLVETRMGAGLDAVVRRVEALGVEVAEIGTRIEEGLVASKVAQGAAEAARDGVSATGERVRDQLSRLGALESRVGQIGDAVRAATDQIRELGPAVTSRIERHVESRHQETKVAVENVASQVLSAQSRTEESLRGQVRSESEQITQRVAALSLAIGRLREAVEALAEESSQTIGRKATEVGRRIAADLGIRGRKGAPENDRDRGRELGPGR
ncbi:MAG: hypothetical protein ACR2H3_10905 [Acidimicrobiales bacterium]